MARYKFRKLRCRMKIDRLAVVLTVCAVAGSFAWRLDGRDVAHAQQASTQAEQTAAPAEQPAPNSQPTVFKAQTKLVLVDSIVTDKKNNYIRDLTQNDFRVWEDNKEQAVKSFSYENGTSVNGSTKHYLVLFFDDADMDQADRMIAR